MSLQEKLTDRLIEIYENGTRLGDCPNSADADEIICIILDAAVDAIEHAEDDDYTDWKEIATRAINKLRGD